MSLPHRRWKEDPDEPAESSHLTLPKSGGLLRVLLAALGSIVLVGAVASVVQKPWAGTSSTFVGRFYVGSTATVSGWWSTLLAGGAGVVSLWARRRTPRPDGRRLWLVAAVLAFGLSVDEHARFHVHVGRALGRWTGYTGAPLVPLVLLAGLAALAIGWWLWRPFLALPSRDRRAIALAALCFTAGAVVAEAIGTLIHHPTNPSMLYIGLSLVEEALEMAGVSIFIWAVYRHLAEPVPGWRGQA